VVSTSINVISERHKLQHKRDIHTSHYADTEYTLQHQNKKVLSRELEYVNMLPYMFYINIHIFCISYIYIASQFLKICLLIEAVPRLHLGEVLHTTRS